MVFSADRFRFSRSFVFIFFFWFVLVLSFWHQDHLLLHPASQGLFYLLLDVCCRLANIPTDFHVKFRVIFHRSCCFSSWRIQFFTKHLKKFPIPFCVTLTLLFHLKWAFLSLALCVSMCARENRTRKYIYFSWLKINSCLLDIETL